ncbi:MAG: NAD(P)H-dependent oxidoreductase subunit E [Spirochaetales bacterium]|nr:NAD(P)H-dependent oxidoreductase subunit E [Spirochaetales bacterium]
MEGLDKIIDKYKEDKEQLIGLLQDVSSEFGYLPEEALVEISDKLDVPLSRLYSLATFYNSFRLEPRGKHHVCVCMGTACHVKGAQKLLDIFERDLNVKAGETTEDKQVTLETVNCLGACALSPLIVVDDEYHGKSDQKIVTKLIKGLKKKDEDGSPE